MSYIGLKRNYANVTDFFTAVCSVAVSAGWTLHDDISSTSKVYTSRGEAGVYAPAYAHIYVSSSSVIIFPYQYWNATSGTVEGVSAHTGKLRAYGTIAAYGSTQYGNNVFIAASKDFIITTQSAAAGGVKGGILFIPNVNYNVLTTTTDSIVASAGAVWIPVANSTGFKVGNKYQILGQNYEGRDQLTVNSIPSSGSIVVAALPRNYASGAYIGQLPCPVGVVACAGASDSLSSFRPISIYNSVGATEISSNSYYLTAQTAFYDGGNFFPDYAADEYVLGPVIWYSNASARVGNWGYSKQYLLAGYNAATYMDIIGVTSTAPETGTASSGAASSLTDTTKSWVTNQWANKWLCIVNGTASGQSRKIVSNTSTVLTLETNWETTNPDATSVYRIVDESYRYLGFGLWALETTSIP